MLEAETNTSLSSVVFQLLLLRGRPSS